MKLKKQRIILGLMLGFYALTAVLIVTGIYQCPLYFITGVPCPGCGLTRASFALLKLNFAEAFLLNPGIYVLIAVGIICLLSILFKKKWHYSEKLFIAVLLLMTAIYLIRMFTMFPNTYPMLYRYDSLIGRHVS